MDDVVYIKKPFNETFDSTTKGLAEIMNSIVLEFGSDWSFVGGYARDKWLGQSPNDYDICVMSAERVTSILNTMGLLQTNPPTPTTIPHDYYLDPYDMSGHKHPIHWIHADDERAYAPKHFDFTINQICLKQDGYFYAPKYTWDDFDKKIIRKIADKMSPNIAFRAIRFACRYGFTIHKDLVKEIIESASRPIDVLVYANNLRKMVDDEVGDASLTLLKEFVFPDANNCQTIEELIERQDVLVESGEGYRMPANTNYNNW